MSNKHDYPNECPPANSRNVNDVIYRFSSNIPPAPSDFISDRRFSIGDASEIICIKCGLSIYLSIEDASLALERARKVWPKHFSNKRVSNGKVSCGKLSKTFSNGHHTWWPPVDLNNLHELFSVISHE